MHIICAYAFVFNFSSLHLVTHSTCLKKANFHYPITSTRIYIYIIIVRPNLENEKEVHFGALSTINVVRPNKLF